MKKQNALFCRNCGGQLNTGLVYCSRTCAALGSPKGKLKGKGKNRTRIKVNGKREYLYRVLYCEYHGLTLGVNVTSDDIIHHIDENPRNNSIENLELLKGEAKQKHIEKHRIWELKNESSKIETVTINGKDFDF